MIALSTPFGHYIKEATESTVEGLFATEEKALNVMGLSALGGGDGKVQSPSKSETITYETLGNFEHKAPNGTIESHDTEEGICSKCNQKVLAPGLYDENDNLIVSWANSEIDEVCSNASIQLDYEYPDTKKVIIGNSVTSIYSRAFSRCSNITSVEMSNSVTSIGRGAFRGCSGLTSVTIPTSVTSIGEEAFAQSGLKSIIIPNGITTIESMVFGYCYSLVSVTIPESVTTIKDCAFWDAGLTSVTIPKNVTSIDIGAFNSPNLTTIIVDEENPVYDSRENSNAIIETATNTLVYGYQTTTIPTSVTSIGKGAFSDCIGLTSITIPNNVKTIGNTAFSGCKNLKTLIIESGVESIDGSAFANCDSLTSVIIPASVTNIGGGAFMSCRDLETVYFEHETLPTIGVIQMQGGYKCFSKDSTDKKITFYFRNSTVADAFDGRYYDEPYSEKSTNYNW